ncbi:hypothetical protein [Polaromonas sp.]|nr:hypothetical protein [Polaromonas sp.]MDI1272032.1 hypothetical protein [Polaromonas sp.]
MDPTLKLGDEQLPAATQAAGNNTSDVERHAKGACSAKRVWERRAA